MNKREMAGEIVGNMGMYMPDAPTTPYYVRLNGKFFCSADTAELADQVTKFFSKPDLVGLHNMVKESEALGED